MTSPGSFATSRVALLALCMLPLVACAAEVTRADDDAEQADALSCEVDALQACDQDQDPMFDGVQVCLETSDGTEWSECEPDYGQYDPPGEDDPPAVDPPSPDECDEFSTWDGVCCVDEFGCCVNDQSCETPLVLSFDDAPVEYTHEVLGDFDLTGLGVSVATDWPTARTPWLSLDKNRDGRIDGGGELFGSATRLESGSFAQHGFEALAELDGNADGVLDARDAGWVELTLWADADASRTSEPGELTSVTQAGLVSIELDYRAERRCDARGNCEVERARFTYRDAAGALRHGTVVDVYLAHQ